MAEPEARGTGRNATIRMAPAPAKGSLFPLKTLCQQLP